MSREQAFIDRLRRIAVDPAARGLADDCALLPFAGRDLVLTHDMLVEDVHYLPGDPPGDVAWKLVAVNLSDLAAKGATPIGVLLGYPLAGDEGWDAAFVAGLGAALERFGVALLGGDTVAAPPGSARMLALTAIGEVAPGCAPARAGARDGDELWVTGVIGAAGLGLALANASLPQVDGAGGEACGSDAAPGHSHPRPLPRAGGEPTSSQQAEGEWLRAYRRPWPRLAEGRALGPLVGAMCDVSDGLLIDARRMAAASKLVVTIDLDAVPLPGGVARTREASLAAATAGDDYELLFAWAPGRDLPPGVAATRIGAFGAGQGLRLCFDGVALALPARLGFEHGA